MKYTELHRKLKKAGCYETGQTRNGHPEWYSPLTGQYFTTGAHGKQEVATGTLRNIKKASGVNL